MRSDRDHAAQPAPNQINRPGRAWRLPRSRVGLVLCVALLISAATGCSSSGEPLFGVAEDASVLLITLDTTRADRIGCYGYENAITPNLDSLARDGVRYDACYSQAPITLVSHASLMTGTYPPEHGVRDNGRYALGPELPVLAELFRQKGYKTGGFIACQVLDRRYGLQRGFEVFRDEMPPIEDGRRAHDRPGNLVVDEVLPWLDDVGNKPFFGWVHLFDPHAPYTPPPRLLEAVGGSAYDGEIAFADEQIGRMLTALRERGRLENTLVIVTADHGESLGDHGYDWHALLVYNGIMRVPLIFSMPDRIPGGIVVPQTVGVLDVAPTLMNLMGWETPEEMTGRSLVSTLRDKPLPTRPIYGESDYPYENFGWAKLRFMVDEHWKYIRAPEPELYLLSDDPGELKNLGSEMPERMAQFENLLTAMEAGMNRRDSVSVALDSEALDTLRSLGYVGGGGSDHDVDEELPDPKKMVKVELDYRMAESLLGFRKAMPAIDLMEPAVEKSPRSFAMVELLGRAYAGAGMLDHAHATLQDALALQPRSAPTWRFLARVMLNRGDGPGALKAAEKAAELAPTDRESRETLGIIRREAARQASRIAELRRSYAESPNDKTCAALAEELSSIGEVGEAVRLLRARIRDGSNARALAISLAWLLATTPDDDLRDGAEAVRLARRGCEGDGAEETKALDTLAAALAESGEFDEAIQTAIRAIQTTGPQDEGLVASIERRMRLYREKQPYRSH